MIAALALCVVPAAAQACPKCFGSSDTKVLGTYYLSTLLLSLLPFAIIASIAAVAVSLRRHFSGTASAQPPR